LYGVEDPYSDNPFKAITFYESSPTPMINKENYKEIYYKTHSETSNLYPEYQKQYDYIFKVILDYFDLLEAENEKQE
jgi:hypothetical protein